MLEDSKDITTLRIAMVTPSLGVMQSKTVDCILSNIRELTFIPFMSHGKPIPDCFNEPLNKALAIRPDYIWFVEDDMYFPYDTLRRMIAADEDVISVDYTDKNNDWGKSFTQYDKDGNVTMTGMGCMLVKYRVFKDLEKPYLRQCLMEGGVMKSVGERKHTHGTQDVYFCWSLRQAGYDIAMLDTNVGHISPSGIIRYVGEWHKRK